MAGPTGNGELSANALPTRAPAGAARGLARWLPILDWGARYDRATLSADLLAALIVTLMLIPQSLAYAQLANLPPHIGLYASIAPLVVYAVFGSSHALAVGPVAVVSLMTAAAISGLGIVDEAARLQAALTLAALSGVMLLLMGVLRLGFLASFLSHPVISGFLTASSLLITLSQLKHLLGIRADGDTLPELLPPLIAGLPHVHWPTAALGAGVLAFLYWTRSRLKPLLLRLGMEPQMAGMCAKAGPVLAVIGSTALMWALKLDEAGVRKVGDIPAGLPPLTLPSLAPDLLLQCLLPAFLISLIGFVESVSVAQNFAARRRLRIDPNQELVGLGVANLAASATGGYPVTGGLSRSVVSFDAGAATPAAGAFTAVGIALASLTLTPALHYLPQATLAATIVVAILTLVDVDTLRTTWRCSRSDFAAALTTLAVTLLFGVEHGVSAGVALTLLSHLWRASRPHMAVVGRVPGSEHFRNVDRHAVETHPSLIGLRVDEGLNFMNARQVEDRILALVAEQPAARHVVLLCSAVNDIDASALEMLEHLAHRLAHMGVLLHLSEVKGPVMDRLERSALLKHLGGQVFLSHHAAVRALTAADGPPPP
ncbi:SulP family inorganic anion transporter [Methyloversatilis thermotolerans]|uniref:SulP family inorganic anion transporter n=1 Tax=Methyloversatilis thermotolerans TaxID=1346290 RepID=UPI000367139D|nr:sulfate permease [Methyloversatilis thermotolerans]